MKTKPTALFSCKWVNYLVHPACVCGWKGTPSPALPAAKKAHARHLREDCPIGSRTPSA